MHRRGATKVPVTLRAPPPGSLLRAGREESPGGGGAGSREPPSRGPRPALSARGTREHTGKPRASPRRNLKARPLHAASPRPCPTCLTRRGDREGTSRAGRGGQRRLRGGRGYDQKKHGSPRPGGASVALGAINTRAQATQDDRMNASHKPHILSRRGRGGIARREGRSMVPLRPPTGEGMKKADGSAQESAR